jgi:enamine deaminase RidA (YjgF/YER057c/UK114 family)
MSLPQLEKLHLVLPTAPKPIGAYAPAVRTGNLIFLSGQLPSVDGAVPPEYLGKLGFNVSIDVAQAAARQATLNALAILEDMIGLNHVVRMVRLAGYISSTPTFTAQPQVLNAASELMGAVFDDAGVHARLALGVPSLPLDACLELELIVEVA